MVIDMKHFVFLIYSQHDIQMFLVIFNLMYLILFS